MSSASRIAPLLGGILVGGASTRMGSPKALLEWRGITFLQHVFDALKRLVEHIVLLGDGPVPPELQPLERVRDAAGARGPLAGILAAVRHAPGHAWVIAACDQPLVRDEAVAWLIAQRQPGRAAILPTLDGVDVEPLLAIYEPGSRPLVEALAGRRGAGPKDLSLSPGVHSPWVPRELAACWRNVNTADELAQLQDSW